MIKERRQRRKREAMENGDSPVTRRSSIPRDEFGEPVCPIAPEILNVIPFEKPVKHAH